MPSRIRTDLSRWPLALVTFPDAQVSDEDIRLFVEEQRAMLMRKELHGVVTDARHARVIGPHQRRVLADWLTEAEPLNRRYTVALAVISDNALVRGAMTAVTWMKEPPVPMKPFATLREGSQYVLESLRRRGASVDGVQPLL